MARVNTCRLRYQFWDSNASVSNVVQNAENFLTSHQLRACVCVCVCGAGFQIGGRIITRYLPSSIVMKEKKGFCFSCFRATFSNFISHWSHTKTKFVVIPISYIFFSSDEFLMLHPMGDVWCDMVKRVEPNKCQTYISFYASMTQIISPK